MSEAEEDASLIIIEDDGTAKAIASSLSSVKCLSPLISESDLYSNNVLNEEYFNHPLWQDEIDYYCGDNDRYHNENLSEPNLVAQNSSFRNYGESQIKEKDEIEQMNFNLLDSDNDSDLLVVDLTSKSPEAIHKELKRASSAPDNSLSFDLSDPFLVFEESPLKKSNKIPLSKESFTSHTTKHNFESTYLSLNSSSPIQEDHNDFAGIISSLESSPKVRQISTTINSSKHSLPKTFSLDESFDLIRKKTKTTSLQKSIASTTKNPSSLASKNRSKVTRERIEELANATRDEEKRLREAQRLKERQTASLNKQNVGYESSCKEITLVLDSAWHSDSLFGDPLVTICEQDGTKVRIDERRAIPYSLSWERQTQSRFDEELDMIVPLPIPIIVPVQKILLKWEASELLNWIICSNDMDQISQYDLNPARFDIKLIKLSYPNYQIVSLVMGTQSLLRKIQAQVSQAFRSQVRKLTSNSTTSKTSQNKANIVYDTKHSEMFESYLVELQIQHDILVIQLESIPDAVTFLHTMTRELSAIPHRPQYDKHLLNLNEINTRKSTGVDDAWQFILQQIHLVTPPIALTIVRRFPSLASLLKAYSNCSNDKQRISILGDLEVELPSGNTKRIGQALSSRILNIFTSFDSDQLVI